MSVNLLMDGNTYEGATGINVGGKNILIQEIADASGGIATGSYTADGSRDIIVDTGKSDARFFAMYRNEMLSGEAANGTGEAKEFMGVSFMKGTNHITYFRQNYNGTGIESIYKQKGEKDTLGIVGGYALINGTFKTMNMDYGGAAVNTKEGSEFTWFAF